MNKLSKEKEVLSTTVRVPVRFSEVDAIRMVWHGNYVRYLEDAREAFGHQYGLSYREVAVCGYVTPIVDMHLQYKQAATVDDVLLIVITYRQTVGAKIIFDYTIHRECDNVLLLTATTTQLFMTHDGVFEPSSPDFYVAWKKKWLRN